MVDISLNGWLVGSLQLQLLVFSKSSEFCEYQLKLFGMKK